VPLAHACIGDANGWAVLQFVLVALAALHKHAHVCTPLTPINQLAQLDLRVHQSRLCHWVVAERIHGSFQLGSSLIVGRKTRFEGPLVIRCHLRLVPHDLGHEQGV